VGKPVSRQGRRFSIPYPVLFVAVLLGSFLLMSFVRSQMTPGSTQLQQLIAANAPDENARSLAAGPGGQLYVGTSRGLLTGKGQRGWSRLSGVQDEVGSAVVTSNGVFLGGSRIGVVAYSDGRVTPLLQGDVRALAAAGDRLYAVVAGSGIHASSDSGRTWIRLAAGPGDGTISLASDLRTELETLLAGSVDGTVSVSFDGGRTWSAQSAHGRSVTALQFMAGRRVYGAIGGAVMVSDDLGVTWQRGSARVQDRAFTALAFAGDTLWALSADGYLTKIER